MNTHDPAAALFTAVYEADEDAVVRQLRAGASPESVDEDGQTVLYLAAMTDDPGVVRLLLAAGASPDRLSAGSDSPLCGAACGGHTEVVRALLAAGARPNLVEEGGFTALTWAVQRGHAPVVAELLASGADPNRPGPTGEPPLVTAARRGSPGCVRALLVHGARARSEALAEARRWLTVNVEAKLRAGLERTHGPGHEYVTHRFPEDGGVTVEVQLLKDGRPSSGNDQQTGHAAIVTLLETSLSIAAPAPELADRALRFGDPDNDDWTEAVTALARRGDEETFRAAALWCGDGANPLRQAFGADVLGRLGAEGGPEQEETAVRPFASQSVPLLRELARETEQPLTLRSVVAALGQHQDPTALPEILRHAGHPDTGVRRAVAVALCGLVPASHAEGIARLVALAGDADRDVRNWATTALAVLDTDTPALRDALATLLDDPDPEVVAEAARGLAVRQDPRAITALQRLLAEEKPDSPPRTTAEEAVEHIRDDRVRTLLSWTLPRRRV
ncbi:ankyrin repeat domain-containing protein [Streptomyces yerevanensis]|uniref:ankyrin repeat domain-containing protein n=1 Tax=Streptomyces yerevanensis TaxID=66378 RepID=UPI000526BE76|nr:ankyrin repeat domain-containing protein [Streptomyces yerevanensis]